MAFKDDNHAKVKDVAVFLAVSEHHVRAMIAEGLIDAVDISLSGRGGTSYSLRVLWSSVEKFVEKRRVKEKE